MGQIMHIGKNWPVFTLHYCGWDRHCRFWSDNGDGPLHRINVGVGRHFFWFDILDWKDRGRHTRTREEYRRLRQGLKS